MNTHTAQQGLVGTSSYASGVRLDAPPHPIKTIANEEAEIPNLDWDLDVSGKRSQLIDRVGPLEHSPDEAQSGRVGKSSVVIADMGSFGCEVELSSSLETFASAECAYVCIRGTREYLFE